MPLTETGFKRRTFAEILDDKIAKCKELFGEDINTEENTPLGKFIRINAYDQSMIEEEAELIYYSIFPNTATGVSLDRLCAFAGVSRNSATHARFNVEITGTAGAVIPKGFLVSTDTEIEFATIDEVTIGESGKVEVFVDCTESGQFGNVNYEEINTIVNPATDVESVQGVAVILKGNDAESDYELRQRFNLAKEGLGACNETAIKASIMRVPTVVSAGVIVNETDETDAQGRPPRSFECYVCGGENYHEEIAKAIYDKKPLGIKTYGKVAVDLTDSGGRPYTIKFSHTTTTTVYVKLSMVTNVEFQGESGYLEIKNNLETYIDNLGIGNPVILTQLYGKIHSVTGVKEVTSLQLSTDGVTWTEGNIEAEEYESCMCSRVEINGEVI